jgi:hypothetical protein
MLDRFTPGQLLGFARRLDPGLEGRDFADAGQRLDQLPDQVFAAIGLGRQDLAIIRQRLTWHRAPEAASRALQSESPEGAQRGPTEFPAGRGEAQLDAITSSGTDVYLDHPEAGQ